MGVSGCGKTTLGKALATSLGLPFLEGDAFHSIANIDKMKSRIPLNDRDRAPWLLELNKQLIKTKDRGAVLACSALKESYRDILSKNIATDELLWVYLDCSLETLKHRLENRSHFMPLSLLESQLDTLEIPEKRIHLDATSELNELIQQIKSNLHDE